MPDLSAVTGIANGANPGSTRTVVVMAACTEHKVGGKAPYILLFPSSPRAQSSISYSVTSGAPVVTYNAKCHILWW